MKGYDPSSTFGHYRILQICSLPSNIIVNAVYYNSKKKNTFRVPVFTQALIEWVDSPIINERKENFSVSSVIEDEKENLEFNNSVVFLEASREGIIEIPEDQYNFLGYEFNRKKFDWSSEISYLLNKEKL